MLKVKIPKFYKVKEGQSLDEIAETFNVSAYKLAKINALKGEVVKGQILEIPKERGNRYTVKEGDSKTLLCGSEENFERWNGTDVFYIGMRVIIGVHKNEGETNTI